MVDKLVDGIIVDEEFIYIYEQEGCLAFKTVERMLNDVFEDKVSLCAETDELFYTKYRIPIIKQKNSYFCGPASTLMALIGSGAEDFNYIENGYYSDAVQDRLAKELETDPSNGTFVYKITEIMQKYYPGKNGWSYQYRAFPNNSGETYEYALDYIESSLIRDAVPIIRLQDTSPLGYYKKNSYQHYMVVEGVDILAESVTVVDPNNLNDGAYLGRHVISFDEFYNIAKVPYFWIIVYAKDS